MTSMFFLEAKKKRKKEERQARSATTTKPNSSPTIQKSKEQRAKSKEQRARRERARARRRRARTRRRRRQRLVPSLLLLLLLPQFSLVLLSKGATATERTQTHKQSCDHVQLFLSLQVHHHRRLGFVLFQMCDCILCVCGAVPSSASFLAAHVPCVCCVLFCFWFVLGLFLLRSWAAVGKSCLLLQFTDHRFQAVHDLTVGAWQRR